MTVDKEAMDALMLEVERRAATGNDLVRFKDAGGYDQSEMAVAFGLHPMTLRNYLNYGDNKLPPSYSFLLRLYLWKPEEWPIKKPAFLEDLQLEQLKDRIEHETDVTRSQLSMLAGRASSALYRNQSNPESAELTTKQIFHYLANGTAEDIRRWFTAANYEMVDRRNVPLDKSARSWSEDKTTKKGKGEAPEH